MPTATLEAPKAHVLVIERTLNATPDQVFEAWVNPEILPKWWGPRNMTTPECEIDARPGGIFRTLMRAADGAEYPTSGSLLVVDRPTRLVYSDGYDVDFNPRPEHFITATTTFEDLGNGQTKLIATVKHKSEEDRAKHEAMGFYHGWGEMFERLDETLAELAQLPKLPMSPIPIVEAAKADFLRAKHRVAVALAAVPDDKLNWSPAPTARTPIHVVAHISQCTIDFVAMLEGKFEGDSDDTVQVEARFRELEKPYTTREGVIDFFDRSCDTYLALLDTLTPAQVAGDVEVAFGTYPMATAITFMTNHLRVHGSQLDYIQTCYGDLLWHA